MQGLSDNKRLLFIVKIFNVIIANIAIGGDICNYFWEILMLYNEDIWEFKKNIDGRQFYIKVKIVQVNGEDIVKCLGFHEDDFA